MTEPTQFENTPLSILRRIEIRVPPGKIPERLDVFLARQVGEITRSKVQEMIQSGEVTVDNKTSKPSYKIRPGDLIKLEVLSRPPLDLTAEDIPLEIVYEDEWLVVINKPAGMVVHPAQGNRSGTLVNALLGHYQELAPSDDEDRPGIVHRLDKETTGLLVACKRDPALSKLAEMFRERKIKREYYALVWWQMPNRQGTVDAPIGRDPRDRKKFSIHSGGKAARTHWKLLETFDYLSLLSVRLETGRTHQIRIHMSSIGHPVFGDPDYAGRNRQLGKLSSSQRREVAGYFEHVTRQMLHARTLGFEHPVTGEEMHFESPMPPDFQWMLDQLRSIEDIRNKL